MIIYGSRFRDVLFGTSEDDTIYGYDGNDDLLGGNGDDHLFGGIGADVINGGAGRDWACYDDAAEGVYVVLDHGRGLCGRGRRRRADRDREPQRLGLRRRPDRRQRHQLHQRQRRQRSRSSGSTASTCCMAAPATTRSGAAPRATTSTATKVSTSCATTMHELRVDVRLDEPSFHRQRRRLGRRGAGRCAVGASKAWSARSSTIISRATRESNVLMGLDGNDELLGKGGDDMLFGGEGQDLLDGGTGFDYARYDDAGVRCRGLARGRLRFWRGGAWATVWSASKVSPDRNSTIPSSATRAATCCSASTAGTICRAAAAATRCSAAMAMISSTAEPSGDYLDGGDRLRCRKLPGRGDRRRGATSGLAVGPSRRGGRRLAGIDRGRDRLDTCRHAHRRWRRQHAARRTRAPIRSPAPGAMTSSCGSAIDLLGAARDVVTDFGVTAGDNDMLVFHDLTAADIVLSSDPMGTRISVSDPAFGGDILVMGRSPAELAGHLLFT